MSDKILMVNRWFVAKTKQKKTFWLKPAFKNCTQIYLIECEEVNEFTLACVNTVTLNVGVKMTVLNTPHASVGINYHVIDTKYLETSKGHRERKKSAVKSLGGAPLGTGSERMGIGWTKHLQYGEFNVVRSGRSGSCDCWMAGHRQNGNSLESGYLYRKYPSPVTQWKGEIIFNASQSEFRADLVIIRLSLDSGLLNRFTHSVHLTGLGFAFQALRWCCRSRINTQVD